ncbi:SDR family NAD(P)-dependent oxidoreductase [Haliea sp. E1-2-M8]|uniref:SDR family NAD(P)-dependent oxidoreductase n=1 Tax=Haliea sp. E1-2-M8 TaxID=3064706 RepID=UPI002728B948|nr:SDR family NAD(P)-dependent oxidoreductase [Haliea sp. E1-2-M8]MDO8863312.1 SDR family NAD(P)-dependent oxidoreductase [Haliea sp. E1-2-M8]
MTTENVALVIGASGGIATAVARQLLDDARYSTVFCVSRATTPPAALAGALRLNWLPCSGTAADIAAVRAQLDDAVGRLARVVICSGILHDGDQGPEKSLEQLDPAWMQELFNANSITPMLWLQALAKGLGRKQDCVIAALSARVGSIGDNRLGGWYGYRASKAALNMLLQTAAVELARRAPGTKLIAFHPGTTDTPLSKPFQSGVPEGKLFSPDFVAGRLLAIMDAARADGTLSYLDWDGQTITW